MKEHLVSIVINNYNYSQYLPGAIESALNQDYPDCEVIVVDDGSRDGSAQVIARYNNLVLPIFKENGGQFSALNAGFESSKGDIVIFLDADDLLEPHAASNILTAFARQPELARVQYRMAVIDARGNPTGDIKPPSHIPVPSGDIRSQILQHPFDIAWLPTSGNAFSASVLEQIMPVPEQYGSINADYYLVHVAPLYGPVLFLDEVLACYRVHASNSFGNSGEGLDMDRLRSTIFYDRLTYGWIQKRARQAGLVKQFKIPDHNPSMSSAASRLVSLKLEPSVHPLPNDSIGSLVALGLRSAMSRTDTSLAARFVFTAWFTLMGMAPKPLACKLADLFFVPERRPSFSRLLSKLYARRPDLQEGSETRSGGQ